MSVVQNKLCRQKKTTKCIEHIDIELSYHSEVLIEMSITPGVRRTSPAHVWPYQPHAPRSRSFPIIHFGHRTTRKFLGWWWRFIQWESNWPSGKVAHFLVKNVRSGIQVHEGEGGKYLWPTRRSALHPHVPVQPLHQPINTMLP